MATVDSEGENIDLAKNSDPSDFAVAYAWAEINLPEKSSGLLGIGSDDAVKAWLNGQLVHENWAERTLQRDDDLVPVQFQAGTNRLVLKIQNVRGDWAFVCRLLSKQTQADRLTRAAVLGELDTVQCCLAVGIDIDGRNRLGLTAANAPACKARPSDGLACSSRGQHPAPTASVGKGGPRFTSPA